MLLQVVLLQNACFLAVFQASALAFVKYQSYSGKGQWRRIVSPPGTGVTMWSLFCQLELAVNSTSKYLGGLPSNVLTLRRFLRCPFSNHADGNQSPVHSLDVYVPGHEYFLVKSWAVPQTSWDVPYGNYTQVILSSEVLGCPTDFPGCPLW